MGNTNLHKAKKEKNDEFYTQISDIEKELGHYKEQFRNKTIFLNCDDPSWSNFWRYFTLNFEYFGLKKLISTHYEKDKPSYKLTIETDVNDDGKIDSKDTITTPLKQNGDFRSPECIELLKEADIVITNPPFSLFREYVAQLMEYNKQFLIIGNMNAITYKETFTLIKAKQLWLGNTNPKEFMQPDGTTKKFGNILWFTNLDHNKRHEKFVPYQSYEGNEKDYPKYDNYNAINMDKVVKIPGDYTGAMGVPITFLSKFNPNQFDIIKFRKGDDNKDLKVNGKDKYFRILIKWRENK